MFTQEDGSCPVPGTRACYTGQRGNTGLARRTEVAALFPGQGNNGDGIGRPVKQSG